MKHVLHIFYFLLSFCSLMASAQEEKDVASLEIIYDGASHASQTPCNSPFSIRVAETFEELQAILGSAKKGSVCAWDSDNTLVTSKTRDLYDFEMDREHQAYWRLAGTQAISQGLFLGQAEAFPGFCVTLLRYTPPHFELVDEALPGLNKSLWERGVETFVCTGLHPHPNKVDHLTKQGLDWSGHFTDNPHVSKLFYKQTPGWIYAPGNKAPYLESFVRASNAHRLENAQPQITDLYFVDNHLETLEKVAGAFPKDSINLHLILWRKHALALATEYSEGLLIPRLVEAYRVLTAPAIPSVTYVDDGYESPPGDLEFVPSPDPYSAPCSVVASSPLRCSDGALPVQKTASS
ncbi:MAG: hypothetical protein C0514_01565 [Candidatus Puniceispirillum sp.]|nr:hypothetical protein [Candidatus Puniceispirillum sp.]